MLITEEIMLFLCHLAISVTEMHVLGVIRLARLANEKAIALEIGLQNLLLDVYHFGFPILSCAYGLPHLANQFLLHSTHRYRATHFLHYHKPELTPHNLFIALHNGHQLINRQIFR